MTAVAIHRLEPDERLQVPVDLTPTLPPLTARETAPILNVSVDTVYDAVARGEIKACRLGRAIRIPRGEIARLLGLTQ